MLLKYFYDKSLAQASYMVGCQACGEALIVDPARDITPYLEAAAAENLRIAHVVETHIHADFVSGSRELVDACGATLYLSAEGGPDWQYDFADENTRLLRDGDTFAVGQVRFDVLHTPGHTPEHIVLLLTDTAAADRPMGLFTGDCLFVGDVGRPDLLESAGGNSAYSSEQGARDQFRSVQALKALPDYLQVFPGHGAGSACGKAIGSLPSSTIGYERRTNPAFAFDDEAEFVAWLLADQPETPTYFAQMKRVNRDGSPLLATMSAPQPMEGFILEEALRVGALVIDTRADGGHVPGAIHIPPADKFNTYAGWFVNYSAPTYLIAAPEDMTRLVSDLRAIGVDNLPGYFTPAEVDYLSVELPVIAVEEAQRQIAAGALVLDVRGASEYASERIAGSINIPYGLLPGRLDDLPRDRPLVIHCSSGVRSQIAASLLMKAGFKDFANMDGGIEAWRAAGLAVESPHAAPA